MNDIIKSFFTVDYSRLITLLAGVLIGLTRSFPELWMKLALFVASVLFLSYAIWIDLRRREK